MKVGDQVTIKPSAIDWVHPRMRPRLGETHTISDIIKGDGWTVFKLNGVDGLAFGENDLVSEPPKGSGAK